MKKLPSLLVLLLAVTAAPPAAESQRVPAVGDQVRVRTGGPSGTSVGTVRSISAQGVEITGTKGELSFFAARSIANLELSQGEHLREGRSGLAMLVFAGVTGAGAGMGAAIWSPCTETGWFACFLHPDSRGSAALVGAVIGFPLALAFAVAIGKDRVVETWEKAELPASGTQATFGLFTGATAGDIGIGLSIRPGGR